MGRFNAPQDIFVDTWNNLYILDSGNKRIIILDSLFNLIKVIDRLSSDSGTEYLENPTGIYVSPAKRIFVADLEGNRISDLYPFTCDWRGIPDGPDRPG